MSYQKKRKGKYARTPRRKKSSVALVVLADVLLVGLILVAFAFFHHVLPAMVSEYERLQMQQIETTPNPTSEPSTATEAGAVDTIPNATSQTVPGETATPTEPDNRTPWQIKFADRFTDDVVMTENSYSSPEVSITLKTISTGEGNGKVTYHVADIYVASLDNFVTRTANGEMRYFGTQDILEMDAAANAILSLSGDFLTYQKSGFLMRNSQIYKAENNFVSICVLYQDGTMQTYNELEYEVQDILNANPLQVWSFGPELLDENGKVKNSYNVSSSVSYPNPRSAIGYYEPGHYVFVLVDGRQPGYSRGMEIPELAKVFEELGCKAAYNLDGGGSAVMVYNHEPYSVQSNGGRELGDILVIRDSYYTTNGEEGAA